MIFNPLVIALLFAYIHQHEANKTVETPQ